MADSLTESNNILSSEINAENADSSHFWLYFFKLCLKRWWLLGIIGIVAAISGYVYALYQQPQYESRLTFAIDAGSNDGDRKSTRLNSSHG